MRALPALSLLICTSLSCASPQRSTSAAPDASAPDPIAGVSSAIDALLATRVRAGEPGAAVLLLRCGSVVHARGYGLARVDTGEAITPETRFELASVSKQFTAFSVLLLARAGLLDLDGSIARYVPELAGHPAGSPTLRQLLTHSSGLIDYLRWMEMTEQRDGPSLDNHAVVAMAAGWSGLRFTPGERYDYSNTNYVLLAQAVENVSHQRFEQVLQQRLFDPMHMARATLFDRAGEVIEGRARGYSRAGSAWSTDDYQGPVVGDGGFVLSLRDFVGWERALATDELLPQEEREKLFIPAGVHAGPSGHYGFGWVVGSRLGRRWVSHDGAFVGFRSFVGYDDARRVMVVVLSNRSDFEPETVGLRAHRIFANAIAGTSLDAPCPP